MQERENSVRRCSSLIVGLSLECNLLTSTSSQTSRTAKQEIQPCLSLRSALIVEQNARLTKEKEKINPLLSLSLECFDRHGWSLVPLEHRWTSVSSSYLILFCLSLSKNLVHNEVSNKRSVNHNFRFDLLFSSTETYWSRVAFRFSSFG